MSGDEIVSAIENAEILTFPRGEEPPVTHPGDKGVQLRAARHPPFAIKFFNEIDPAPRKDWLIRGMFGAGEMSIVYGEPGCGKSVLATDLAVHVAAGVDWHGRAVRKGAVLYVAAERAALTERRLAALKTKPEFPPETRFGIIPGHFDFFSCDKDALRLVSSTKFMAHATGEPTVLIVIDTVARVIPGADENHSRDIGRFIENLEIIRAGTGAHVLAIHHAGKEKAKGLRGSTALLGAADTTLYVENLETSRAAMIEKANDGDEGAGVFFTLESVELSIDPDTGEATSAPIVVSIEQPAEAKPKRQMADVEKIALDCLHAVLDEFGVKRDATHLDVPLIVDKVVHEKYWRDRFYCKTKDTEDKPDTLKKRFQRVKEKLVRCERIGKAGDWAWPTR